MANSDGRDTVTYLLESKNTLRNDYGLKVGPVRLPTQRLTPITTY